MKYKKLGDIITIAKGKKHNQTTDETVTEKRRLIQIEDLRTDDEIIYTTDITGITAEKDDILIAWDGANAGIIGINKEGLVGSTIARLRIGDKSKFYPLFIAFYLKSKFEYLRRRSIGAAIPHISKRSLESIDVPEFSIESQIKLTIIFQRIETLILIRGSSIELLNNLLESTYNKMFNSRASKSWVPIKLENFAKSEKGSMRSGPFGSDLLHEEFTSQGYAKVLGIDNVVNNRFEDGAPRYIDKTKFEKLKRYKISPGDVLITIMGTVGRSAVVPKNIPLSINTKHLVAITLDTTKANPYFISYLLSHNSLMFQQFRAKNKGAIMSGLNLGVIKSLKLKRSPISLQNKFGKLVEKIGILKNDSRESLTEIESLLESLLERIFSEETFLTKIKYSDEHLSIIARETEKSLTKSINAGDAQTDEAKSAITAINKSIEKYHNSLSDPKSADRSLANTIKQLDTELALRGVIPYWPEYVKHRLLNEKFSTAFTFIDFMTEIQKFSFEEPPHYDQVSKLIFDCLEGEKPFLRQFFHEFNKEMMFENLQK